MAAEGWKRLIPSSTLYRGNNRYPIDAYSEFMPPPRLGWKPYFSEAPDPQLFDPEDPWGWHVTEYEEQSELQPGLAQVAQQVVNRLYHLCLGETKHAASGHFLKDNLYWSPELSERSHTLAHEHCVLLMPLALSRTLDDKGRVGWTLFGVSEQGPARAFWKSFQTAPKTPGPEGQGPAFFAHLLRTVYHAAVETPADLTRAGFRILPQGKPPLDLWEEQLPDWTRPFLLDETAPVDGVKYLLTFRPFAQLPEAVREAYLRGALHLLPTPASLIFWGAPRIHRLHQELPLALQAPLLKTLDRKRAWRGLRVSQAGILHEPDAHGTQPRHPELVRNTIRRTHRWERVHRDADELALEGCEDKVLHVLFSVQPDDMGLYDKPMARNVQLWTDDGKLLLDGPNATRDQIHEAMHSVESGGEFGYRFFYPPMRVGVHDVYWHRPLVAFHSPETNAPAVVSDAPLGYLTAYATNPKALKRDRQGNVVQRATYFVAHAALQKPVELWPRLHQRPLPLATVPLLHTEKKGKTTAVNVRKLFDAYHLRGNQPLPRRLAASLLTLCKDEKLDGWLNALEPPGVAESVRALIEPEEKPLPTKRGGKVPESLTFARTATRAFEVAYWKTIALLADGQYLNRNNADCVVDKVTENVQTYAHRQLDTLGDYLLDYYRRRIKAGGMSGRILAGELPFRWETDMEYKWMGGWLLNRDQPAERNLIVTIPGKDRKRTVIMADHYDTAYMADAYETGEGVHGAKGVRLSADGADDNYSATAALMLAAPIFMELSKAGKLGCDVWLVHLTGEEFPADCLGARHLTQSLVEGNLTLHLPMGKKKDLSGVQVEGVYVSDMIAHNNDRQHNIFQMAPGTSRASLRLAEQASLANAIWNESVPIWNEKPNRKGRPHARRSPHGAALPEIAQHLALTGQVRPVCDPHSTLYNTDGQIFSDAGVPVVLFMENYDINRCGYHDTHDTMANIDLDYGAALAAIVIESVAQAANS